MAILRTGRDLIAAALLGEATKDYNSTGAMLCVGNSTGAENAASTFLLGVSKAMSTMEATYPSRVTNALAFRGIFGLASANFDWREWGIFNSSSSALDGAMLNRKLEDPSLGTKLNTQTWQFTATVTVTT